MYTKNQGVSLILYSIGHTVESDRLIDGTKVQVKIYSR